MIKAPSDKRIHWAQVVLGQPNLKLPKTALRQCLVISIDTGCRSALLVRDLRPVAHFGSHRPWALLSRSVFMAKFDWAPILTSSSRRLVRRLYVPGRCFNITSGKLAQNGLPCTASRQGPETPACEIRCSPIARAHGEQGVSPFIRKGQSSMACDGGHP